MALVVKNLAANAGDRRDVGSIPRLGRSPGRRAWQPTPGIPAWRIPWTEKPGGLQSIRLHRVRHDWLDLACTYTRPFFNHFFFYWVVWDLCIFWIKKESESEVALSCLTLCDPMDCTHQAPPSMEFFRQEYWNGLPLPSPGDLPDPGIEPGSPTLQADTLLSEPPENPIYFGDVNP